MKNGSIIFFSLAGMFTLLGAILSLFWKWSVVFFIISIILLIISKLLGFRGIRWFNSILVNLIFILFPLLMSKMKKDFKYITPQWRFLPSSEQFYSGPGFLERKNNFNFDSLMLPEEELRNLQISTTDTDVGPGAAPGE